MARKKWPVRLLKPAIFPRRSRSPGAYLRFLKRPFLPRGGVRFFAIVSPLQ